MEEVVTNPTMTPETMTTTRRKGGVSKPKYGSDVPTDEQGRPRMPLHKDEGRNSDARELLGCTERRVVGLVREGKLIARRNPVGRGEEGQWIINLRSVREYAAVAAREDEKPRPITRGGDEEISDYLTRQVWGLLVRARIYRIDGRELGLDQAWAWYKGPTGKRNLLRLQRNAGPPTVRGVGFLIESDEETGVRVFFFKSKESAPVSKQERKLALAELVRSAARAARVDATKRRARQEKEAERKPKRRRGRTK